MSKCQGMPVLPILSYAMRFIIAWTQVRILPGLQFQFLIAKTDGFTFLNSIFERWINKSQSATLPIYSSAQNANQPEIPRHPRISDWFRLKFVPLGRPVPNYTLPYQKGKNTDHRPYFFGMYLKWHNSSRNASVTHIEHGIWYLDPFVRIYNCA